MREHSQLFQQEGQLKIMPMQPVSNKQVNNLLNLVVYPLRLSRGGGAQNIQGAVAPFRPPLNETLVGIVQHQGSKVIVFPSRHFLLALTQLGSFNTLQYPPHPLPPPKTTTTNKQKTLGGFSFNHMANIWHNTF